MEEKRIEKETNIRISVRNLLEFILRSGDIDNRRTGFRDKDAMQAGSRIHRKIQKQMPSAYMAEVSLRKLCVMKAYSITVEGRADGIFPDEDKTYIDEIKGVYMDLSYLEQPMSLHRAQAMCYAYFFADMNEMPNISIQITYVNIKSEDIRRFREDFSIAQLEEWFSAILMQYIKWADYQYEAKCIRQASIRQMEFPFPYRAGQKDLVVSVYRSIQRKKTLFVQAPTGTGKTISTVFPAVKAVGEGLGEKLFYLTAKTITRTVAEETFSLLKEQGLSFKNVTITAKEKICFLEERDCNPQSCPYAKGHYDRVNDAVYDMLTHEQDADREKIEAYAKKHMVCPFEMCLDVTNWVDGIICDYNYVFDPNVKLKRYFSEGVKGEYLFLVDEAHNLVERAREMFSAVLYKSQFLEMKQLVKGYSRKLAAALESCNRDLLALKRQCDTYEILQNAGGLTLHLMGLAGEIEKFLEEFVVHSGREKILSFYFEVRNFLNIHEMLDENYRIYTEHTQDGDFLIKLFCVNTAKNLSECIKKSSSTVFFSATLLPIQYYRNLLSGNSEDYAVYVDSVFEKEKRLLLMAVDVSSRYARRNETEFEKICSYLGDMLRAKKGNYMVFFPSYSFMESVYELAIRKGFGDEAEFLMQTSHMQEEKKEAFLNAFEEERDKSMVAFCVLGGIFSEGIDLKAERLIGTMIVGTGLPQICTEREILKGYYEERGRNGFDYAYRFPGLNKVLQAAGRVIRTSEDEGVILLLDERLKERSYKQLFPREWSDIRAVTAENAKGILKRFWGK